MITQIFGDRNVWSGGCAVLSTHFLANIEEIDQSLELMAHAGAIVVSVLWVIYIWKKIKRLQNGKD